MRSLFLYILLAGSLVSKAGEVKYPVSAIPESLKKNADAVKREDEQTWEIANSGELKVYKKYAVTVLNEDGEDQAVLVEPYDKFIQIKNIEGTLFDGQGNEIKRVKTRDVEDVSAVQDISLIDDNRVKRHRFYYKNYPYTVVYEIEMKISNSLMLPHMWMPQDAEHLSVETSKITIVTPSEYSLHFKAWNYKGEPVVTPDKNRRSYTWQVSGLAALKSEFACPNWNELTTSVYYSPADFEMEGYKGNMNTWRDYGKFIYELNKGRDQLPDDVKQTVKELTEGVTDTREKVKRLYGFMQQHTRYISIQLGIGGLQPFEASFVAKKGYGDCKALSNYMYSLLKEAGIRSLYTLVRAGRANRDKFIMPDFPNDPFNHIILCVPIQKDSMWLECTSQDIPAGYMGDFTGNRMALAVDETGGTLVATPRYGLNENLQIRNLKASLDEEGTLRVITNTDYKAVQEDGLRGLINSLSPDLVKKELNERFELATYDVNKYEYKESKGPLPALHEQLDLSISNYATITGKRLFIAPNILNRGGRKADDDDRHFDYVFNEGWRDVDSVDIEIPKGYKPEAMPAEVNIKNKYGYYHALTVIRDNHIYFYRTREQYPGRFSATEKEAIDKFFGTIYKSDHARIVFVKGENQN